jgi:hypothetical protein
MLQYHIAFYPHLIDACYVDAELVRSDPESYYGSWIIHAIAGPFMTMLTCFVVMNCLSLCL